MPNMSVFRTFDANAFFDVSLTWLSLQLWCWHSCLTEVNVKGVFLYPHSYEEYITPYWVEIPTWSQGFSATPAIEKNPKTPLVEIT